MFRNTILSLTAAVAVAAIASGDDAKSRLVYHNWNSGFKSSEPAVSAIPGPIYPCGHGWYRGGDGKCHPLID